MFRPNYGRGHKTLQRWAQRTSGDMNGIQTPTNTKRIIFFTFFYCTLQDDFKRYMFRKKFGSFGLLTHIGRHLLFFTLVP